MPLSSATELASSIPHSVALVRHKFKPLLRSSEMIGISEGGSSVDFLLHGSLHTIKMVFDTLMSAARPYAEKYQEIRPAPLNMAGIPVT